MSTVDDIRARLDIVDVVNGYVPDLKRTGSSYKARCPFHQENTPSFVVFPNTQSWRCFGGCATGGDMFSFVMRTENTDFTGAMRLLAAQAGVRIEERRQRDDENPLYALNDAAQQFFKQSFIADRGAQARSYVEGRHIGEDAVARFGIGYAPSTGGELLRSLGALGFNNDLLLRSGLVLHGDDGTPSRDMFRGRLMFPLRDTEGRIAGFAGRTLDGSNPKYINTPQTSVFDKGRMLYALDRAREAITAEGEAVVVEGYMDVIAAHEHGYRNVVASMGTALTETQVSLLKARAQRIVLALDADAAGQEAMLQSLRTTWELVGSVAAGRRRTEMLNRPDDISSLRIALITEGKDPDELIRKDPSQWQRLLTNAVPAIEFLMKAEASRLDIGSAQGKSALVERLLPVVFALPDWAQQERYFTRLAEIVGVPVATLEAAVGRMQNPLRSQRQKPRQAATENGNRGFQSVFTVAEHDPLEERVLALLAQEPEFLAQAGEVDPDTFVRPENRAVLFALRETGTIEGAIAQLDGQLADRLVRHSQEALPPADRKQRTEEWTGCLRRLEERRLRNLKAQEAAAFSSDAVGDAPADPEYVQAVHRQALEINERLRELFTREID